MYAHEFFHERHAAATRQLGGDLSRDSKIGSYMRELGLCDIQCNSFAPVFAKGVQVQPWTSLGDASMTQETLPSQEKFDLGFNLLELSLGSLIAKLKELDLCTEAEIAQALDRIQACKSRIYMEEEKDGYQVLSLPDGTVFQ